MLTIQNLKLKSKKPHNPELVPISINQCIVLMKLTKLTFANKNIGKQSTLEWVNMFSSKLDK
jgi:hypothetical protein